MAAIQSSLPATIANTATPIEEEFGPRSVDKLEVSCDHFHHCEIEIAQIRSS